MILDRLTIVLPWPDPMLFPNKRRGSFRKFQPFIEAARNTGFYAAKKALGQDAVLLSGRTPVKLMFAMPDNRNRDSDGLHGAIKHHLDGIAKALGVDDKVFRPVLIDDCLDIKKQGFVIVEIGI
jgi:crossover junction endodeoxyribonuclease RusA